MSGPGAAQTVREVLATMGVEVRLVRSAGGPVTDDGNANWHVWPSDGRQRCVLRRYHSHATADDLAYEHAVLSHLSDLGWAVAAPIDAAVERSGRWYCLTAHVPGHARADETATQQAQRGADLARLQLAMAPLATRLGQRAHWQSQHLATTVHADLDWDALLQALSDHHPGLAHRAAAIGDAVRAELDAMGAHDLPVTVIHGDFAEWNVHYQGARLAGVIDFALTHLDSRPYELAIARSYRAPETVRAYVAESDRLGWPLSELELASIGPVHRAFRIGMVAWQLHEGARSGRYDIEVIDSQLKRATA